MKVPLEKIELAALGAVDGTPVLDIKAVLAEILPSGMMRQPSWSPELTGRHC